MADHYTRPELERILDGSPRRAWFELVVSLVLLFSALTLVIACLSGIAHLRDDVSFIRGRVESHPRCQP